MGLFATPYYRYRYRWHLHFNGYADIRVIGNESIGCICIEIHSVVGSPLMIVVISFVLKGECKEAIINFSLFTL